MMMLTKEKQHGVLGLALFTIALGVGCVLLWRPVSAAVADPAAFRAWVEAHRDVSALAMIGLMLVQVVFAFLPGEPVEIAAGYACGAWGGPARCLIGATLGCLLTAGLTRRYGRRVAEVFFPPEKIDALPFFRDPERQMATVFILYLIPGTPKDLFNYALGLTKLSIPRTVLLTAVARIPSVITSTISGDALGAANLPLAAVVLGATAAVSLAGLWVYRRLCR